MQKLLASREVQEWHICEVRTRALRNGNVKENR